jgi:hypothetical protein
MAVKRIGDIELEQDIAFQRKQWRIERVGWGLIALLVVLAAAGLFGTGPLSSATAGGETEGLTVEYERFVRRQGQAEIVIAIDARHASNGQVAVRIDGDYLASVRIQEVSPQPVEVRADGSDQVYVFAVADGAASIEVIFGGVPLEIGRLAGEVGTGDSTVSFSQFSYP